MALPQPDVERILNRRRYLAVVGWGRLCLGVKAEQTLFTTAASTLTLAIYCLYSPYFEFFLCVFIFYAVKIQLWT